MEGNYLAEQVEAIKELGDHITNLKRVGTGHGEYHFDRSTLKQLLCPEPNPNFTILIMSRLKMHLDRTIIIIIIVNTIISLCGIICMIVG